MRCHKKQLENLRGVSVDSIGLLCKFLVFILYFYHPMIWSRVTVNSVNPTWCRPDWLRFFGLLVPQLHSSCGAWERRYWQQVLDTKSGQLQQEKNWGNFHLGRTMDIPNFEDLGEHDFGMTCEKDWITWELFLSCKIASWQSWSGIATYCNTPKWIHVNAHECTSPWRWKRILRTHRSAMNWDYFYTVRLRG